MKFKPLQDRLLIRRIEVGNETPGGIIIPDAAKEKPCIGEVIAAGFDVSDEVVVGDTVLFSKYSGTEVEIGDGEHLIIRVDDILGVEERSA